MKVRVYGESVKESDLKRSVSVFVFACVRAWARPHGQFFATLDIHYVFKRSVNAYGTLGLSGKREPIHYPMRVPGLTQNCRNLRPNQTCFTKQKYKEINKREGGVGYFPERIFALTVVLLLDAVRKIYILQQAKLYFVCTSLIINNRS